MNYSIAVWLRFMLKSIVQKNTSIKWCFYVFNAGTPPLREKVYSQIVTWESISILKGKTFTVLFQPGVEPWATVLRVQQCSIY